MQMQNGGGGNRAARFRLLAIESGGHEHAHAHQIGVGHFQPNFRSADRGIENGKYVVDAAFQNLVGISVQMDIGILADVYGVEIVFVNIADDPDIRQIGDGERIGAGQALHTGCVGDLLVGDHSGGRGDDVDDSRRVVFIDAEK